MPGKKRVDIQYHNRKVCWGREQRGNKTKTVNDNIWLRDKYTVLGETTKPYLQKTDFWRIESRPGGCTMRLRPSCAGRMLLLLGVSYSAFTQRPQRVSRTGGQRFFFGEKEKTR